MLSTYSFSVIVADNNIKSINRASRFVPNWSRVLFLVTLILNNTFSSAALTKDDYTFNQLGQDIDGDSAFDASGRSVALSNDGKVVVVGAYRDGTDSGSAKVYKFDVEDYAWIQVGQDLDGENYGDRAGYDVDISENGQIVAVGNNKNRGYVRVYQYNENRSKWEQMGDEIHNFGYSLSLSGNGLVLASSGYNSVLVYEYDGTAWNNLGQRLQTKSATPATLSLSQDGRVLAVGHNNPVEVFLYEEGTGWTRFGNLPQTQYFGYTVSLSGNGTVVAIGGYYTVDDRGAVFVFKYDGRRWSSLGDTLSGIEAYERFGASVKVSSDGDRIAVGAQKTCRDNYGRVALYQYNHGDGSWFQVGENIYGENPADQSGIVVAMSGDGRVIAQGSRFNDNDNGAQSGHVRVFESVVISRPVAIPEGHILYQLGQDIYGEAQGDFSGFSVALSNNGKVVAIGAHLNDFGSVHSYVGHTRVYKFEDDSWIQMGQDLDGEYRQDWAGYDVDLSDDGRIVAVGANLNDGGALNSGHVRVYRFNGNMWEQLGDDLDGEDEHKWFGTSLALSADGLVLASAGRDYVQVRRFDGMAWNMLGQELDFLGENAREHNMNSMISLSSDGSFLALGEFSRAQVQVFKYVDGTGWIPLGPTVFGTRNSYFGSAVSLSSDGSVLVVGSLGFSWRRGSVHMFRYTGSSWISFGSPVYGTQLGDYFGHNLEVSNDGQRFVVGAQSHDGWCHDSVGKVELFEYDGCDSWVQVGRDLMGEVNGDLSGNAVAISGDGGTIAYGARAADSDGARSTNDGEVKVFGTKRITPGASGTPISKHGLGNLMISMVSVTLFY